ncbi:MAG: hypothetical protein ACI9R3_006260, partial [Verrucomicrobiales bacterium]
EQMMVSHSKSSAKEAIFSSELQRRSDPSPNGTRFTQISASESGIDFINSIDTSHSLKKLYALGYAAGGVAIGDLDGDSRPDLFFANGPRENGLFLQKEPWKFIDVSQQAGITGGEKWGTGVAMVDIENDGDLDLYVCNYDAPNELFINDGAGIFVEMAEEFGLADQNASLMPAFADADNDGDLDLYILTNSFVRDGGQPANATFLQDGAPTIKDAYRKYFSTRFVGIFGDKRRDEIYPVGQRDRFYVNEGPTGANGTVHFRDASDYSGDLTVMPGKGLSATWWDANDDGQMDLYVGNDFEDSDHFYLNETASNSTGKPRFRNVIKESVPQTTWYSMGADVADVNNDGLLDFFSVDMAATTHFKAKAQMGDMASKTWFMTSANPPQHMRNALFINTGTGRFLDAAYMAGMGNSDWSWAPKLADFDNDGRVDVFISNGMSRPFTESDIIKNLPMSRLRIGKTDWDIFEDYPPQKEKNLAFVNRGDLRFEPIAKEWGLDHEGMTYATAYGDLDRDGDLDLVTVNLDEPVGIYRNDSPADEHSILIQLKGSQSNHFGIGANVRIETTSGIQVRQMNPATGFLSSNDSAIHFGLGNSTKIQRMIVRWPSGIQQEFSNLEADMLYTIEEQGIKPPTSPANQELAQPMFRESSCLSHAVHAESLFNDFARQPLLPNQMSQLGPGMAAADVNGDQLDDLYLSGAAGHSGSLFLNLDGKNYSAAISAPFNQDAASEDMGSVFFDIDNDGDQDLYVVSGGYEADIGSAHLLDRLYLNDGTGGFAKAPAGQIPDLRDSGGAAAAADIDHDGDIDLFIAGRLVPGDYPMGATSRLLINDGGTLTDQTQARIPAAMNSGMVTGAVWSDATGDGWVDLLLSVEWGPIRLFRNQDGQFIDATEEAGLAKLLGWWNGISSGDMDNDGDIDYAVTNFGLNTKYHASADTPALLYYGDFDGSGTRQIIEAEFEDATLFPVRGKSCSTNALPHLGDKFRTYRSFAAASLEEIYTPQYLDSSLRLEARILESGILINDGSGKFSFNPLPRIAQTAPAFGSALVDIDADGMLDLYMVQNFYTPQLETGRMAGGLSLLLRGKGDGTFDPVSPRESGLLIPEDAKSLAVVDTNNDSRPDFIIGINNGALRVFENQTSRASVRIAIDAKPGSTITAKLKNGIVITREVQAGAGYLSQSGTSAITLFPAETEVDTAQLVTHH